MKRNSDSSTEVYAPERQESSSTQHGSAKLGIIGLGTMGRNLLLNLGDKGVAAAGYDTSAEAVRATQTEVGSRPLLATNELVRFVNSLEHPRVTLLLVPAAVVDKVLTELTPLLAAGDIIVDGGNSYFLDTERRERTLAAQGIQFLGMGISGGEAGARHGPSLMPGGPIGAYQHLAPILGAVAAKADQQPCVAYMGPHGAGHFVKMVHNGIEYGLMQLIAESYHILKAEAGLDDKELAALFADWNQGQLSSYLMEITADIFTRIDQGTHKPLVDLILDEADQHGTGRWTSQESMALGVPIPTIDAAVSARSLSDYEDERARAAKVHGDPRGKRAELDWSRLLRQSLAAAMTITYAQGFSLLYHASERFDYGLDLASIASIWRGGCIIRSAQLETFRQIYARHPRLPNLLLDQSLAQPLQDGVAALRQVVARAAAAGIPLPAMMATLAYFDAYRSSWLPANLIQAQRDYFGSHTYRRRDEQGTFHTIWAAQ